MQPLPGTSSSCSYIGHSALHCVPECLVAVQVVVRFCDKVWMPRHCCLYTAMCVCILRFHCALTMPAYQSMQSMDADAQYGCRVCSGLTKYGRGGFGDRCRRSQLSLNQLDLHHHPIHHQLPFRLRDDTLTTSVIMFCKLCEFVCTCRGIHTTQVVWL